MLVCMRPSPSTGGAVLLHGSGRTEIATRVTTASSSPSGRGVHAAAALAEEGCIQLRYQPHGRRTVGSISAAPEGREVKQATYTKCVRPAAAAMARMHIAVHRATRGRVGRRWRGGQVALLSTVGRRTRRRRTTLLLSLQDVSPVLGQFRSRATPSVALSAVGSRGFVQRPVSPYCA